MGHSPLFLVPWGGGGGHLTDLFCPTVPRGLAWGRGSPLLELSDALCEQTIRNLSTEKLRLLIEFSKFILAKHVVDTIQEKLVKFSEAQQ